MKVTVKRLYEGMFLVDSAQAAADWDGVLEAIRTVLDRAGAEIVSMKKWDECRLAYEIKGVSRGTYILTYFKVDGQKIHEIERDVQLSERIMRVMILNAEHKGREDIEADTSEMPAEQLAHKEPEQKLAEPQRKRSSEVADEEAQSTGQGSAMESSRTASLTGLTAESAAEESEQQQKEQE